MHNGCIYVRHVHWNDVCDHGHDCLLYDHDDATNSKKLYELSKLTEDTAAEAAIVVHYCNLQNARACAHDRFRSPCRYKPYPRPHDYGCDLKYSKSICVNRGHIFNASIRIGAILGCVAPHSP